MYFKHSTCSMLHNIDQAGGYIQVLWDDYVRWTNT